MACVLLATPSTGGIGLIRLLFIDMDYPNMPADNQTKTIDLRVLDTDELSDYFKTTNAACRQGMRLMLDYLGIPLPECAKRRPAGRPRKFLGASPSAEQVNAAFRADNPDERRPSPYRPLDESTTKHRNACDLAKRNARDSAKAGIAAQLFDE